MQAPNPAVQEVKPLKRTYVAEIIVTKLVENHDGICVANNKVLSFTGEITLDEAVILTTFITDLQSKRQK